MENELEELCTPHREWREEEDDEKSVLYWRTVGGDG